MSISKPTPEEFPDFYGKYIALVKSENLIEALTEQGKQFNEFIYSIPSEIFDYRYAEGKWTVKEIISHILDAERIFAYRALRFARNDKTNLHGFEENNYVPETNAANRTIDSMLEEMTHVRCSTILLFFSFSDEMTMRKGIANGREISVRALGYIIAGHMQHHMNVIKERYL